MASFTDALRSSGISRLASIQRRQASLRGRPLTQSEAAAPYEAQADTAAARLATMKQLETQEKGQAAQEKYWSESLAQQATQNEDQMRFYREQLAEQTRLNEAKLAEDRQTRLAQMAVAQEAMRRESKSQLASDIVSGAGAVLDVAKDLREAGGVVQYVKDLCIIVTACQGPFSPDVELAREYKAKYLGPISHEGYHRLARYVVPLIGLVPGVRWVIRRTLVDRLVDYGSWVLGYRVKPTIRTSRAVTRGFLWACGWFGKRQQRKRLQEARNG